MINVAVSAVIGSVLLMAYQRLQPALSGALPPGPPDFQREQFQVWTANALLSVTFPFLVVYAAYGYRRSRLRTEGPDVDLRDRDTART